MEIPERIQKAFNEVVQLNENIVAKWINPTLELASMPEHINDFFIVNLDGASSIYDSINAEICNVCFHDKSISVLYRVRQDAIF